MLLFNMKSNFPFSVFNHNMIIFTPDFFHNEKERGHIKGCFSSYFGN